MMDRPAIHAAEAFVQAGYPLDAEALLIVELDGPEAEVDHLIGKVEAIARDNRASSIRISRNEAERLAFWAGRKAAFPAVGRHLARLLLHGRHDPARPPRRGADADRRAVGSSTACASPTSSMPATAICIR